MKVEVGKKYLTKGGPVAEVLYSLGEDKKIPFRGAIEGCTGVYAWDRNGVGWKLTNGPSKEDVK